MPTRVSAVSVDLGPGPPAAELVRRAADRPGLVGLDGDWADGCALVTSDPVCVARDDPIAALDEMPEVSGEVPDGFVGGGWFGHLSYDGASRLGFHDHLLRRVGDGWRFEALWSDGRDAVLRERLAAWRGLLAAAPAHPHWQVGRFTGRRAAEHLAAVERAIELIRAGELYQVNVCTRLTAPFAGSPAALFADALEQLRPARGAFVDTGSGAIASLSPELFLHRRGRDVRTAPIKGTLPRLPGNDAALRRSAKDAAENVMIVDLMRNDLGRVCVPGSVHVPALLDVEPHPGLWHLVSTVTGWLREGVGDAELLRATFPPGSVTGAPKVRAVAAIAELEDVPRGAYTGVLGFASPCFGTEFSVAIRTFEIGGGRIELGVGGGVTADSVPMLEWRECGHKAAPLLAALSISPELSALQRAPARGRADNSQAAPKLSALRRAPARGRADNSGAGGGVLETILVVDGEPVRLADHLARLDRSCRELYGAGLPGGLAGRARAVAAGHPRRSVLRIVVDRRLDPTVTVAPAGPAPVSCDAVLVPRPAGLWRHKWADRTALAATEAAAAPSVPIFIAPDGTVTETSRGNVFLIAGDGGLITAPLHDEVLPGVTRRAVLDRARDEGRRTELRSFDAAELTRSAAFWTSSLSGAVPIASVDGVRLPRADGAIAAYETWLLGGGPASS